MFRYRRVLGAALLAGVALGILAGPASGTPAGTSQAQRYVITLKGDYAVSEGYAVGSSYAVYAVSQSYAVYAVTHDYAVRAIQSAGGTVTDDLSQQIGVIVAQSTNAQFATLLQRYAVTSGYAVIDGVSKDRRVPIRVRRSSGG